MQASKSELVPALTLRHGDKAGGCTGATTALTLRSVALIVTGTMDGRLVVWSATTGRELASVTAHSSMVLTLLELSRDSSNDDSIRVVSHGRDGRILLWIIQAAVGKSVSASIKNEAWFLDQVQSDDVGLCKASLSLLHNARCLFTFVNDKRDAITSISFSAESAPATEPTSSAVTYPVHQKFSISYSDQSRVLPGSTSNTTVLGMCMQIGHINHLCRQYWLTAHENGSLVLWGSIADEANGKDSVAIDQLHVLHVSDTALIAFDFSAALGFGLCGATDDQVTSFELDSGGEPESGSKLAKLRKRTGELKISNPGVSHIRFDIHGRLAAIAGWDNRVRIVSLRRLHLLAVISYHSAAIHSLFWSSHNDLLIASDDALVTVWATYRTAEPPKTHQTELVS